MAHRLGSRPARGFAASDGRADRAGPGGCVPPDGGRARRGQRTGGRGMSTVQAVHAPAEVHSRPTVLALARVEARRFALHPLFLFGTGTVVVLAVVQLVQQKRRRGEPHRRGRGDRLPGRGVRLRRGPPADDVDAAYCRPGRDRTARTSAADGGPVPRVPRALRRGVCGHRLHAGHADRSGHPSASRPVPMSRRSAMNPTSRW